MGSIEHKKILIMGAGERGKRIFQYFKNSGTEVAGFLDNSLEKQGAEVEGVRVYPENAFCREKDRVVVIVSLENDKELEARLKEEYSYVIGGKEADGFNYLPKAAGYERLFPLGHFYSLYPDVANLKPKKDGYYDWNRPVKGIDLNEENQLKLLEKMTEVWQYVPEWGGNSSRARYGNQSLSHGDMIGLCSMLQILRPNRMIEVGSGYSSAVSLDTNELLLGNSVSLFFIEPYPQLLYSLLRETDHVNLRVQGLEDVELEYFEQLETGDILFIDSTHVSKMGSDVNSLFFEILPRLKRGVYVHLHDIFYPFEYPWHWIADEGMVWNELYLLRAFLQYNAEWEVVFFQNMMEKKYKKIFLEKWPVDAPIHGGSFWMRKK